MAHKKDEKVVLTIEQLKTLVRNAFEEGRRSSIDDELTLAGGISWKDSKSNKSMQKVVYIQRTL